jgi:hypothetical protein
MKIYQYIQESMLTSLNKEIVNRLSKGKQKETVKHGMDIAIISLLTKRIVRKKQTVSTTL